MVRHGAIGSLLGIALISGCTFETQPPDICSFDVSGTVSTDTTSGAIEGTLYSSTAPLSVSWKILRAAEDYSSRFKIDFTPPGASATQWNLSEQGHARLRNLSAPPDTYTLVATLVDGDGVTTVQSAGFRVLPGCTGTACDLPLPAADTLQGLSAQDGFFSLLSIQNKSLYWIDATGLSQDQIDLLLRWETDHLEFVSPAADSALDPRVAAWTTRNLTIVVPSRMTITGSTTPREILQEIAQHPVQTATVTVGGTYLFQCADGSVGWLTVSTLSVSGSTSLVDVAFAVVRLPKS